ncbi:monofunctional biosynthetic peptidoglycan transglycosylase [Pseudoruegeria sp. HB172150]|uniref:monofunctional biosynthetic peptidoglycan transglycosylase n=1 Tax=Pseudoruegeria sp. HB172150 TaxID=2721164 RepID=UPI001555D557|nr:monofunctional biosynthetic peptidoglycan transglycosylase [Pseudoruegeria sp. HB172150]
MAKKTRKRKTRTSRIRTWRGWLFRWAVRAVVGLSVLTLFFVMLYAVFNPPTTPYILSEGRRLGDVERVWVDFEDVAPAMPRSIVAAEDANFCLHWGFDMTAIRAALAEGANRGASTISQQLVKNVYLWHGRSWLRKAMEAGLTPVVEMIWSKRRILEVYMNVVEFDEGVFGVEAAAQHYFGVSAKNLTDRQAALLAAVLPDPKGRSASQPSNSVSRRAQAIQGGAATIRADGRDDCFES